VIAWSAVARAATCSGWVPDAEPLEVAGVTAESSGLAPASLRPGVWYTHGDHGGDAVLYAFRETGEALGTHGVPGADLEDWEDLADAPCPDEGRCLYIGDIGDNDAVRSFVSIRIVREPPDASSDAEHVSTRSAVYPDGPHDAEALLVHSCTAVLYVVTKEGPTSRVFALPDAVEGEGVVVMREVAALALEGGAATGGDWDADGERVALRNEADVFLWATDPEDPDGHWDDEPIRLASPALGTGEAVAFGPDGGLWLTAEAAPMPFAHLTCLDPIEPDESCAFPQTGPAGCCSDGGAATLPLPVLLLLPSLRAARSGLRGRRADSR
jgi:hypothetical protein